MAVGEIVDRARIRTGDHPRGIPRPSARRSSWTPTKFSRWLPYRPRVIFDRRCREL